MSIPGVYLRYFREEFEAHGRYMAWAFGGGMKKGGLMDEVVRCWCGCDTWIVGTSGLRCVHHGHFLNTQPVALAEFVSMSNQFNRRQAEEKEKRREREDEGEGDSL